MRIKKILTFLLFIFFLCPFLVCAQFYKEIDEFNADSLRAVLPELRGKERIDALNMLALTLCFDFPDSSISIANNTIALSETSDYQKGLADGYFNKGNVYFFLDSIKPMVLNYLNALRIYEDLEPCLELGFVLIQLGDINRLIGKYEQAKNYNHRALQVYHSISEHWYEINCMIIIASYCQLDSELDKVFSYCDEALVLLDKYPDDFLLISAYFWYGRGYTEQYFKGEEGNDALFQAISWTSKANKIAEKLLSENKISAEEWALGLYNVGTYYYYLDTEENRKKGIENVNKAKSIVDTLNVYIHLKLLINRWLAEIEYRQGNFNRAITIYKKTLIEANAGMSKFSIKNYNNPHLGYTDKYLMKYLSESTYASLYKIYRELGDYKNALEYYILKGKAAEEILQEDNRKLIAVLEADSENEKTEKKIALLENENELKEMKVDQSRNINLGVAALFVILFMVGLLFLRQNRLKNEHKSTLLEQKLLRLQMNPHFIFNALSSIHSLMNPRDVTKASDYLGNFSRLLRSSLESSREDYILLEEEISSLKNYLELQQLRYEKKFDYKIDVDPKIDLESAILPPMLLQPFIENAIEHGIKHKEAKGHIRIRFNLEDKKLSCEIEDDGVGREKAWEVEYEKKGKHKSLATEIIRDRIIILNKKLKQKINLYIIDKISETEQPTGTLIKLDLPYILD